MTSVMSLTALNSYGVSDINSAIMVSDPDTKRMSLADIVGVSDYGAKFTLNTPTGIPASTDTQILCDSIEYDTGNFTTSTSIGVFYIKDSTWEYVQVGFDRLNPISARVGFTGFITINSFITGGPDGYPVCESADEQGATLTEPVLHASSEPLPVSSGDTFELKAFSVTDVATILTGKVPSFWIRGYKRRG